MKPKYILVSFGIIIITISILYIISFNKVTSTFIEHSDASDKIVANKQIDVDEKKTDTPIQEEPLKTQLSKSSNTIKKQGTVVSAGFDFDEDLSNLVLKHPPPKQWEEALSGTEATIVELSLPTAPSTIEYKPALDKIYHYITAAIKPIGNIEVRSLSRYNLFFDQDPKLGLVINYKPEMAWLMRSNSIEPVIQQIPGKLIVEQKGELFAVHKYGSSLTINNNPLSKIESEMFKFDFPKNMKLNVGATWESPGEDEASIVRHKLAGYALVNNVKTAKVTSSCDNYKPLIQAANKALPNIPSSQSRRAKRAVAKVREKLLQFGAKINITTYISLDEGLINRREYTVTTFDGDNEKEITIITQLAETKTRE